MNVNVHVGFSSNIHNPVYVVKSEPGKLTIEEMNA
jgi:salicylate hydroxylase